MFPVTTTALICIVEDSVAVYHQKRIIFFDGVCNLCNKSVQFIMRNSTDEIFLFAPLQSSQAIQFLKNHGASVQKMETIVYYNRGHISYKSTAALKIALKMNGLYPLLVIFMLVPRVLRDWVYDAIAGKRYLWFGKRDRCMVPSEETKNRFVFIAKEE